MKGIPTEEKEKIINLAYDAVRSGLANGDYRDIENKVKFIMRGYLQQEALQNQILIVRDFIIYVRKRVKIPGGRLAIVALINMGRVKGVPKFIVNCGTAIWGGFFSNKANSKKLKDLFLN